MTSSSQRACGAGQHQHSDCGDERAGDGDGLHAAAVGQRGHPERAEDGTEVEGDQELERGVQVVARRHHEGGQPGAGAVDDDQTEEGGCPEQQRRAAVAGGQQDGRTVAPWCGCRLADEDRRGGRCDRDEPPHRGDQHDRDRSAQQVAPAAVDLGLVPAFAAFVGDLGVVRDVGRLACGHRGELHAAGEFEEYRVHHGFGGGATGGDQAVPGQEKRRGVAEGVGERRRPGRRFG
jgi:hypothetical protein